MSEAFYFDVPQSKDNPAEASELASIRRGVNKDYELDNPNSARALKEAETDNLDVVFPAANELQIDIDSDHAYAIYQEMYPLIDKYYFVSQVKETPSRSGGEKRHITVILGRDVSVYERIALQIALGSDRVREYLSVVQAMQNDPHPTLFLEKK